MEVTESGLQEMFAAVLPLLDERQRRLLAGAQARALGHGGIGMVAVVAPGAVGGALTAFAAEGFDARAIGEVAPVDELGGRYAEGPLERPG